MLTSANEHSDRQRKLTAVTLTAARRARNSSVARVAAVVAAGQLAVVRNATEAVPQMLAEQDIDPGSEWTLNEAAFVGVAADGRPLDTLIEQADTDAMFDAIVATQLADMARMAAGVMTASRPQVGGYIRVINPGACSRCAVQAGKHFKWNKGFDRHPNCLCYHVPANEADAPGLITSPDDYFHSLPAGEQERVFTKAGARAIRDGADIGQVVNARRAAQGMAPAGGRYTLAEQKMLRGGNAVRGSLQRTDVYGRSVFITREGITVRGMAGKRLGDIAKEKGQRYSASKTPRLMPESIYEVAGDDRDEAIRLLRRFGFIL